MLGIFFQNTNHNLKSGPILLSFQALVDLVHKIQKEKSIQRCSKSIHL